jgi:hypothetical protein
MKNRTNSIIGIILGLNRVCIVSGGIEFWPVQVSLVVDAWLVVPDSLPAFLLNVIHYFAVDAKFPIL